MDSGCIRLLTTDSEGSLDDQLSVVMTYSKYEHSQRADLAALDDFMAALGDLAADKVPAE